MQSVALGGCLGAQWKNPTYSRFIHPRQLLCTRQSPQRTKSPIRYKALICLPIMTNRPGVNTGNVGIWSCMFTCFLLFNTKSELSGDSTGSKSFWILSCKASTEGKMHKYTSITECIMRTRQWENNQIGQQLCFLYQHEHGQDVVRCIAETVETQWSWFQSGK